MTIAGVLILLATIKPTLSDAGFAIGMGVLGIGMGLMISQLGNVIQSSVDESGRSEAGGLQFTGQQLGSALGVAFIGAIVLIGLTNTLISTVNNDPRISDRVATQVSTEAANGVNFVSSAQIATAANDAGISKSETDAIVNDYETAQLRSLKAGLLGAAFLALISLAFTADLPHEQPTPDKKARSGNRVELTRCDLPRILLPRRRCRRGCWGDDSDRRGTRRVRPLRTEIAGRRGQDAYGDLRKNLGRVILLGLEVLIIADIIRTIVVDQSVESVIVLGTIVLIRIVLSFSLEVEIDGMWPWNRWRIPRDKPPPDKS